MEGLISLNHVPTKSQLANICTKPLTGSHLIRIGGSFTLQFEGGGMVNVRAASSHKEEEKAPSQLSAMQLVRISDTPVTNYLCLLGLLVLTENLFFDFLFCSRCI